MPTSPHLAPAAPAHLAWRLFALAYDLLPLLALWFAATMLALLITGGSLDVQRFGHRLLVQALLAAVTAAYFVVSWRRGGQTIGMRPWRLRVVRADGGPLATSQALLRFAVAMVSLAPAGLGFWWAIIDARRRTWHDLASRTLVVRIDKGSGAQRP